MVERKAITLNSKDNVATALADLQAGDVVETERGKGIMAVTLVDDIVFGHKFSLTHIKPGSPVIKYGEIIGKATQGYYRYSAWPACPRAQCSQYTSYWRCS